MSLYKRVNGLLTKLNSKTFAIYGWAINNWYFITEWEADSEEQAKAEFIKANPGYLKTYGGGIKAKETKANTYDEKTGRAKGTPLEDKSIGEDWDRKSREEKQRILTEAGLGSHNPDSKWAEYSRAQKISIIGAW